MMRRSTLALLESSPRPRWPSVRRVAALSPVVTAVPDITTTSIHPPRGWPSVARVGARPLGLALVAAAAIAVAGCSLHLHNPDNAKRARTALDTYDKLKVDSLVTTSRGNMAELSKAQLETRQRVSEVLAKVDLAAVIGAEPDKPDAEPDKSGLGPGWRTLVPEVQDALGPYDLLKDGTYSKSGLIAARSIRNRASNKLQLGNDRRTFRAFVEDYKAVNPAPGTQDTDCKTVLAKVPADQVPPPPPPGEPPFKWNQYTTVISRACRKLKEQEDTVKEADDALMADPEYRRIVEQITQLEGELSQSEAAADALLKDYNAAKEKLAEAEQEAAKRLGGQETAAAKAEVEAAQAKLGKAVRSIDGVVEASQKAAELLQVQIKTDLLETILSNTKALSGDPKAAAAKPTQQLLAIVKRYPDIAARFKATDVPPVNVLLLELAIQRLHYRRLQAVRDAKKDIVTILKLQREAHADGVAAWIRVMDNVILARDQENVDLKLVLFDTFTSSRPIGRQRIAEALVAYGFAKQSTENRMNVLNARLRDRYRAQSLEMTEIAITTWNDLIRAPLSEITAYHEGGITSEEIARLINALAIMAIAVGVYQ